MLNPFPIQFLSLFAYAALRLFVAIVFLKEMSAHVRRREAVEAEMPFMRAFLSRALPVFEFIVAAMFVAGFLTQVAALLGGAYALKGVLLAGRYPTVFSRGRLFYFLLFGAAASLFVTGAGYLAVDLPL